MNTHTPEITHDIKALLGLESKRVRLVEHQPGWAAEFLREKERLSTALKKLDLEANITHIGSTAIHGIPAKPIIDTLIEFPNRKSLQAALAGAETLGLKSLRSLGSGADYLFSLGDPVQFYHHFTLRRSAFSRNSKRMMRVLKRQPGLRREYTALKEQLAEKFPNSRIDYTRSKQQFLQRVLVRQIFADEVKRAMVASTRQKRAVMM